MIWQSLNRTSGSTEFPLMKLPQPFLMNKLLSWKTLIQKTKIVGFWLGLVAGRDCLQSFTL